MRDAPGARSKGDGQVRAGRGEYSRQRVVTTKPADNKATSLPARGADKRANLAVKSNEGAQIMAARWLAGSSCTIL